jgi:hypothetical protein
MTRNLSSDLPAALFGKLDEAGLKSRGSVPARHSRAGGRSRAIEATAFDSQTPAEEPHPRELLFELLAGTLDDAASVRQQDPQGVVTEPFGARSALIYHALRDAVGGCRSSDSASPGRPALSIG